MAGGDAGAMATTTMRTSHPPLLVPHSGTFHLDNAFAAESIQRAAHQLGADALAERSLALPGQNPRIR